MAKLSSLYQSVRCWKYKPVDTDRFFELLEAWLEKHYKTAEVLAIVIGGSGAIALLQYQNGMMS